jgi:hypothetical protein
MPSKLANVFRTVILGDPSGSATSPARARVTPQLASPAGWTSGPQLQSIVYTDIFGGDYGPLTRSAAMAVPAVARARHLLCQIGATMPLVSMSGATKDPAQPQWMQRTDSSLSPWHRMVWTIDDCLFFGWSLWAAKRGAASDGSPLLDAARVPYERWEIDADGFILVDQQEVSADQVILIPGPHGGILNDSSTIIRLAGDNLQAAANAARNPNPNVDLHYTGDDPMDDTDIDALLQRWSDARRGLNGGVGYTNKLVEAKVLGSHLDKLLIEGRNADAVDVARAISVPASSIDATNAGASLTYETTDGRNQQLLDYGASFYMDAIAARLSQDDCVPRGHRTAFDADQFTTLTPAPTGAPTDD